MLSLPSRAARRQIPLCSHQQQTPNCPEQPRKRRGRPGCGVIDSGHNLQSRILDTTRSAEVSGTSPAWEIAEAHKSAESALCCCSSAIGSAPPPPRTAPPSLLFLPPIAHLFAAPCPWSLRFLRLGPRFAGRANANPPVPSLSAPNQERTKQEGDRRAIPTTGLLLDQRERAGS